MTDLLLEALRRLNIVLASTTVLIAASLAAYLFVYNVRNAVARAFVWLLCIVTLVYAGDVFLVTAQLPAEHPASAFFLRLGWLGIALAPPAFLHFSYALVDASGQPARERWPVETATLGLALLFCALGIASPWVVARPVGPPGAVRLDAGPYFLLFALPYLGVVALGVSRVWRARARARTARARRRATGLLASVVVPLSVFPYLIAIGGMAPATPLPLRIANILANVALILMLLFVASRVAFEGALTPDRAVRRDFVKYLVYGPVLGAFVLLTIQFVPDRLEDELGLPRDVVIMMVVVGGIVVYPFLVRALKPVVDRLAYVGETEEVMWLRRLDERLVTDHDLAQLFENLLATICEPLRVDTGCVVVLREGRPTIDAFIGSRARSLQLIEAVDRADLDQLAAVTGVVSIGGFLTHGLRPGGGEALLGLLAVEDPRRPLSAREAARIELLVEGAEGALADRLMQERVLSALRELEPELQGVQRLRGALASGESAALAIEQLEANEAEALLTDPDFPTWVKDALKHYWGGPKLTESPLQDLRVAQGALAEHDQNTAKALRSVLDEALAQMRPDGARSMTASQWLLYNILELKFVRRLKVREVAERLAMSEASLYRKQRLAIDALAAQLAAMEAEGGTPDDARADAEAPRQPR